MGGSKVWHLGIDSGVRHPPHRPCSALRGRTQLRKLLNPGYFMFQVSLSSPLSQVVRRAGELGSQWLPVYPFYR